MRNTMKTAIILFIFLTQFIFLSSVFAQTPEITNGINYLISTQNPDGSFGDEIININMPFYSTTEAVNTFKALQETGTTTYTNAVQWLSSYPVDNEGYIAWRMSALSGGNIDLSSDLNLLLQWRNTDKGWGGYDDYLSSNLHTCLMLQAFKALNYSDLNLIGNTLGYLMGTQNTDGGWGFYKGDDSNVYMTALVLNALSQFKTIYDLNIPINSAVTYLLTKQNADGGFGSSVDTGSTVYETALAFEALTVSGAVGADKAANIQSAINYLTSTQFPNGSWEDDPYSTALALKVLYLYSNQSSPPVTGTVTGEIVDGGTNAPLAGVSVALQSDATVSTVSDSSGNFSLANITPGDRIINISLSGYATAAVSVGVTSGSTVDIGVVSLSQNPVFGTIKGTVTDSSSGQPLSGVAITVNGSFAGSATTGTDGAFIFTGVTPGSITIAAIKPGYNSITGTGTVTAGGILLFNLHMTETPPQQTTGSVAGKVVDSATNQPVGGVFVELLGSATIRTDTAGNFTLPNVPSGNRTIFFSLAGYTDVAITIDVVAGAINQLGTMSLSPNPTTGVIRGIISDAADNKPLEGVLISVAGSFTGTATTDAGGNYILTNVTPGTVTMTASKTGYNTATGGGTIMACEILTVNARLTAKPTPLSNLIIRGITFSNTAVIQGTQVYISASIFNNGYSDAGDVLVRFYDGDPNNAGLQIGQDQTISITQGGSGTLQVQFDTSGKTGRHDIFALVDPMNIIKELDETDNAVSNTLLILEQPDLFIDSSEIVYNPHELAPDTTFTIMAPVRLIGENPITDVTVALFDGQPYSGGTKLAETVLPIAVPLRGMPVNFELSNQSLGAHGYYITVDPYNGIVESDKTNNTGVAAIEIKDPTSLSTTTDLYIAKSDIIFNPAFPVQGQAVTISATVHSRANLALSNVDVSFYNGNPEQGGILLRTITTSVAQMSQKTVTHSWTMPGGVPVIYVVIDKDDKIKENDKTNNTAYKAINTYSADLSVTEMDINLDPVLPERGQPVTLNITVNNLGNVAASGTVSVYEESATGSKTLIGTSVAEVAGSGHATVTFGGWSYPIESGRISVAVDNVDPGDSDLASNEATAYYGEDIGPGSSNKGKDFWIAWADTQYSSAKLIIQSEVSTRAIVHGPSTSWSGNVSPGSPGVVILNSAVEVTSNGSIENKGIHIVSDADVTVVFISPTSASVADDAYLAVPVRSLGTEYFDISYDPTNNTSESYARITVVATSDNTNVRIGATTVKLNKGQTYQVKTKVVDLTGSYIRSDKPITVITGNTCIFIPVSCGACDPLLEQLLPVSLWGTDYFTAPLYSPYSGDFIRIVAAEDNTAVNIATSKYYAQDNVQTITLNRGQWTQLDTDFALRITSTRPIEVAQFRKGQSCAGGGDPFELLSMPNDKLRTSYRFYAMPGYDPGADKYGNFITIMAPEPETNIVLDGNVITPSWLPLPGNSSFVRISIMSGEHVLVSDKPVSLYVHGYVYYGSYAYPAGFGIPLPDLTITDLSLDPPNPSEGQLVGINATLSNIGELSENVIVRAYNGDPASGGTLLGEVSAAVLYTGVSFPIRFVWDTYGYGGANAIYVVADPLNAVEESDKRNNAAMVTVEVTPAVKPDLTIADSDLSFSNEIANQSETVVLSVFIWNRGSSVGNIPVSIYLGDPGSGGVLLETKVVNQIIFPHSSVTVDYTIDTAGFNNTNDIFVIIDPDNTISEIDKSNNTAMKQLRVNRGLVLATMTDKTQYPADSDVGINIRVENDNISPFSGYGDVYIEDSSGNLIAHVAEFSIDNLLPVGIVEWKYRIPAPISATYDMRDSLAGVHVDFSAVLGSLGMADKTVDRNSIRVLEVDDVWNVIGEKQARADFQNSASADITWLVDGPTTNGTTRYFYVFFDTTDNGLKEPSQNTKLPQAGKFIAFVDEGGRIYTAGNNGDGSFGPPVFVDDMPGATYGNRGVGVDDFNNDGFLDIVAGAGNAWGRQVYYYRNKGDGLNTFYPRVQIGTMMGSSYLSNVATADFNKDGNKDFVISGNTGGLFYLFKGKGNGTFTITGLPMPSAPGVYTVSGKSIADTDGDGKLDIVAASNNGDVFLYKGKGDATFLTPVKVGHAGTSPEGVALGDFDEDGKIDIIMNGGHDGSAYILRGNGDGTFQTPANVSSLATGTLTAFAAGDFNNDGHLDMLAATYTNKTAESHPGRGDGVFGLKTIIAATADTVLGISPSPALPELHPVLGVPEIAPSQSFTFTWNTGRTVPENHKVHVALTEGTRMVAEDYASFEILPDIMVVSNIVTDKLSYSPNHTAVITSTITSQSLNAIIENLSANITVANNQGTILYIENNTIPILLPGQVIDYKTYWNTGTNPPGVYPITLTISDSSGNVISTGTTNITISSEIKPSALLRGTISLDKQIILQGDPLNILYSVTNVGNIDLGQVDLSILTVHAVNQTIYNTLADQTSLTMGQAYSNMKPLGTDNYSAKDYLVILRATISGVEETLAGTYFRVEGAPSAPSLSLPQQGEDVETLTPMLTINNASDPNDDRLTYEFELYADAGLAELIVKSAMLTEGENVTSWQAPLELQENKIYHWRARAYDGLLYGEWMTPAMFRVNVENDPPTAPTLSAPADNSDVDTFIPTLVVNNASDPDSGNLTYNFELALDPDFTQIVDSQIGIFEGQATTSWQVSVNLSENTTYYWRAEADDWLITGPWMTQARFFVNTSNEAPAPPSIIAPANDSEITALYADILAANSTDPDSADLTYIFEVDTVMTFDSANIMRSGSVPEGQATTLWSVSNLNDNTRYYARVKANDGQAESQWSEVIRFFVNTMNEPPTTPVLANPSDGSGVNTFNPALSVYNSSDIDGDVLTYEFELYADAAMATLVTNISGVEETPQTTLWTVPVTLTENSSYYWRARANDGELYSGWMPQASFMVNTANDAPGAPMLNAPAEGISIDTLNPALSVHNAADPDSDSLTYEFEVYSNGVPVTVLSNVPQDASGITSITLNAALSDNTTYAWRARAYDGDRYGAWMDMASFSIHLPVTSINATINFDPDTLNQKSKGNWVTVYIELPSGHNVADISISSLILNGTIHAEAWPYSIGDFDKDGIADLMVKFNRADVINLLPNGDNVEVMVTGTVGTVTFEGVDVIRVIH